MPKKFIDLDGLAYVWNRIKASMNELVTGKADINLSNVTDNDFRNKANDAGVGGVPIVVATSTDGVTYSGSANGITALTTGVQIVFIPNKESTDMSARFNLNDLGEVYIRQSLTSNTATTVTPANANWLTVNKPVLLEYDGSVWKTVAARSNAADMYGTLDISKGGTGAKTAAQALKNLGGVASVNSFMADADGNVNVKSLVATEISADADLNNYKEDGVYTCHLDVTAATILNAPSPNAFFLEVRTMTDCVMQLFTAYPFNLSMHVRLYYAGEGWGAWKEVAMFNTDGHLVFPSGAELWVD